MRFFERKERSASTMIPHRGSEPVLLLLLLLPLLPLFLSRGLPDPSRGVAVAGCSCCSPGALCGTSITQPFNGPPLQPSKFSSCHTNPRSPVKIKQNKPHLCKTAAPAFPHSSIPQHPQRRPATGHEKTTQKKSCHAKIMQKIMSCHAKNVQKRDITPGRTYMYTAPVRARAPPSAAS